VIVTTPATIVPVKATFGADAVKIVETGTTLATFMVQVTWIYDVAVDEETAAYRFPEVVLGVIA
jgi:hypothetical protein